MAIGDQQPGVLGPIPDDWLVRASLPQVALLRHANLLVTHGGNNSVTEALTHGVPMLVLPFSTDQFDGPLPSSDTWPAWRSIRTVPAGRSSQDRSAGCWLRRPPPPRSSAGNCGRSRVPRWPIEPCRPTSTTPCRQHSAPGPTATRRSSPRDAERPPGPRRSPRPRNRSSRPHQGTGSTDSRARPSVRVSTQGRAES